MLFLITMTHTAESCPGNDPQKLEEAIEALEKSESFLPQWNAEEAR